MEESNIKPEVLEAALAGLLHGIRMIAESIGEEIPGDLEDKSLESILQAAEMLASGEQAEGSKDSQEEEPLQVVSILKSIEYTENGVVQRTPEEEKRIYFPLRRLALEKDVIMPVEKMDAPREVYTELVKKFLGKVEDLNQAHQQGKDPEIYLESLLALMQEYTWCIPTMYRNTKKDVSLLHHSRMTAALAAILKDTTLGEVAWEQLRNNPQECTEEVALLVGGDLSGVQDFIYTITNKGATSALRGRSFYLQSLTEAAARFTLRELGLPLTNLIYGGGGNFYILARASDKNKLSGLRQKLGRMLYKHHQGDLYVAVEGLVLAAKDFMMPSRKEPDGKEVESTLSKKWGELALQMAVAKNRRFADLTEVEFERLFQPQGHGGNKDKQCQVCGREHPLTQVWLGDQPRPGEEGVQKCPACHFYEELGDKLRNANYIGWRMRKHPQNVPALTGKEIPGGYKEALEGLGFEVQVGQEIKDMQDFNRVWALNDEALKNAAYQAGRLISRRLLVNVTPHLEDDFTADDAQIFHKGGIKPFEKLAKDSQGIKRLGILRADVDNLGKIFAEGLGKHGTLARIAALSFTISLYFEGWVGVLAEKRNEKRKEEHPELGEALYAIYSGGDDLFLVGAWDELAEFALEVQSDLARYSSGHPGIHISGGIVLAGAKYPLAKAAEDAAVAEKKAKGHTWYEGETRCEKNAFCFLGQPLDWKTFMLARTLKEKLQNEIEKEQRTSVIRKLLQNYALYQEKEDDRRRTGKDRRPKGKAQTLFGPWNWRMVYLLKRNLKNKDAFIQEVSDPGKMEWIGLAARWAELEER